MKKIVKTDKSPEAVGPYSQAILIDNHMYISGQIAINPITNLVVEEDIALQTVQVLNNLKNILEEEDFKLRDVVKTTIFLIDLADMAIVNEIYGQFFPHPHPARSALEVRALPKGSLIEIEAIAYKR